MRRSWVSTKPIRVSLSDERELEVAVGTERIADANEFRLAVDEWLRWRPKPSARAVGCRARPDELAEFDQMLELATRPSSSFATVSRGNWKPFKLVGMMNRLNVWVTGGALTTAWGE